MNAAITIVAAVLAVGAVLLAITFVVRAYLRYRGTRVITCPETHSPAAVKVDATYAAVMSAAGRPELRLADCSRWPEREDCGQDCLAQIQADPEACLAFNMLSRWYADKSCVYCGKEFEDIRWLENRPALMSLDGKMAEWSELRMEALPEILATHQPVCWNCYIAQTFRAEHPELVVERPWKWKNEARAGRK